MTSFLLGSIRGLLGLDSSDYTKGILDAQVANEVFGHSVVNFVNNPLLGSLQIFKRVASGTAEIVRETAFLNQEYLRTSERLGVSTRTLSGLNMAYRDQGVQIQELEKQLSKLAIKADEAAQGNETSRRLFERLNVTVTDSAGNMRDLDDILRDVSDGMAGLGSQQEKVAIGSLLFGESFVKVLSLLGDGSRIIEQTIERAERYGQVVGQDAAEASNELASALGDLGFAADGAKRRLATRFISAFIDEFAGGPAAVDAMAESIGKLEPAAQRAGSAFGSWISDTIEGLGIVGEALDEHHRKLEAIREAQVSALDAAGRVDAVLNERTILSHPLSGYTYQRSLDSELYNMGSSREAARRAARGHYPDEIAEELERLHARQERMRSLRAVQ